MSLTLREVLDFAVVRAADPDVLVGGSGLDEPVRWVHSSEIYEIGPLLSGGELLLTTGLGLAGTGADERRSYVRDLAEAGLAGLALELGRTFDNVPADVVDEAYRRGFPLIALRSVVPFIRIAQAVNTHIVDRSSQQLRLGDEVTRALNETLISGAGVAGLLATAAAIVRAPLAVVAASGNRVAQHGGELRHGHGQAAQPDSAVAEAPIVLHGQPWGRLLAGAGSPLTTEDLHATLERTATALALAVLHVGNPPGEHDRQAAAVLTELVESGTGGDADLARRAGLAGFHPAGEHRLIGVAAAATESGSAIAVLDGAARVLGAPCLRARVLDEVLGVLAVPPGGDALTLARAAVTEAADRGGTGFAAALGHVVVASTGLGAVRASLRDARATLALGDPGVHTSTDRALDLLLIRSLDRDGLTTVASRALGPVIAWDRERNTDLVRTLDVFLRHGCSATRSAAVLHIGRQSFYQRLDRIQSLLGYDVDDPHRHAGLLLSARAHRLASG